MKPLESFVKSHHDELMVRRLIIRVSGVREGERGEGRDEWSEGGGESGGEWRGEWSEEGGMRCGMATLDIGVLQ